MNDPTDSLYGKAAGRVGGHGETLGRVQNHDGAADPIEANPDYKAAPDRAKREVWLPDFSGHPCPPAAEILWLCAREAGCAPPWRVRVSALCAATYGLRLLYAALAPHAQILMTPDGRSPAPCINPSHDIEFNLTDQMHAPMDAPIGGRIILPGQV